jgi:hypothetical protein
MSSDFFVWCFIVVKFEEIWTRPYRDVMVWRTKYSKKWSISTLREKYINWNWLDQAWGRFAMLCTRWMCVRDVKYRRFSLKMLLKLASKCWDDDLNEICWCASFVCWPKMVLVLHLIRSFLKYLCEHPRVRLKFWKLMCWICWHPRVRLKFYVRFPKWIVKNLLTAMYESCATCSIFQRKSIH